MGPLAGLKVIEMAGIGPGPMCAMLLADLGAQVLRIDRTAPSGLGLPRPLSCDLLLCGRKVLPLDLKKPQAVALVLRSFEAQRSGKGQVVDAAIVDGTASLMTQFHGMAAAGLINPERGTNVTASGAPFYDVYECADGGWMSVGPIESKFLSELFRLLDIDSATCPAQMDRAEWPAMKDRLATLFRLRTRDEWARRLEGTDACCAAVLTVAEAPDHAHLKARGVYIEIDRVVQPAPAPRFSRSIPDTPIPPQPSDPARASEALQGWIDEAEIDGLMSAGVLADQRSGEKT
jgi:crotonobetainyl-CoA:carnitine CoA-transferase CaiB-like acyl-CoA transferase